MWNPASPLVLPASLQRQRGRTRLRPATVSVGADFRRVMSQLLECDDDEGCGGGPSGAQSALDKAGPGDGPERSVAVHRSAWTREGHVANREDGALLVQVAQWGSMMGIEEAQHAVWADDFDPATATTDDVLVSRILSWGETIGTLTKNGLLDTDLVLDWLWVSGLWSRVGPAAVKLREKHGEAALYENFEALATLQA